MVWGGEVTVNRKGSGKGGRNLHMALVCAKASQVWRVFLGISLATDGEDGSTDAAGAIFDGSTVERRYQIRTWIIRIVWKINHLMISLKPWETCL